MVQQNRLSKPVLVPKPLNVPKPLIHNCSQETNQSLNDRLTILCPFHTGRASG